MKKIQKSQIKIGATIAYVSIAINILLGLIYTPWMIDKIGKSDYGIYTLANSIITLFLFDFGLSAATSKFVSKYRVDGDSLGLKNFLSAIYQLYGIIDIIIFVILTILFFNIESIYSNLSVTEIQKLKVVFGIAGLYSLISFPCLTFNGILTAYEKIIVLKLTDLGYRLGSVIFTIVALFCGYGLYSIVIVNVLFGLFAIFIKYVTVKKSIQLKINFKKKQVGLYREVFSFSVWSTVSSLAQRLVFNITPTIIGIVTIAATEAIALFGVISTIEGYFYTISTVINGMFIAKITRICNKENYKDELTDLSIKVGKFQYFVNGLLIIGFVLVGKDFMLLWMGIDFMPAYYGILFVVTPGLFFNSLQIANTALIVQNKIKYQAIMNVFVGVCNVFLSFYLSYKFGAVGASASICIAYFLRVILNFAIIKHKLDFDFKRYLKECYVKMSIPLVTALLICLPVLFLKQCTWMGLMIKSVVISIVYTINAFFLGLDHTERNMIIKKIRTIKQLFRKDNT